MTAKERQPRLGRGLAALMGDVVESGLSENPTIRSLVVAALQPGPFQPRSNTSKDSEQTLENLASSIRASGILQPLLVRPSPDQPETWQIIAGERRWRAAQMVGLHDIPCLIRNFADADAMAAGLVENLQRQDLNAIEEAEGYRRLASEFGLRQEDIARAIGRSRVHVANTLRLLGLPDAVQGEVRSGALSAGHARALLAHHDPQRAALQVVARGLNVRQTEDLCRPRAARRQSSDHSDTVALERELSSHLGLAITVTQSERGGHVKIAYETLEQLDGVVRLLLERR